MHVYIRTHVRKEKRIFSKTIYLSAYIRNVFETNIKKAAGGLKELQDR